MEYGHSYVNAPLRPARRMEIFCEFWHVKKSLLIKFSSSKI